jgi:hypothetical protein
MGKLKVAKKSGPSRCVNKSRRWSNSYLGFEHAKNWFICHLVTTKIEGS